VTFLSIASLYLASFVAYILVLSLFRTKRHRREVSALFLWEGLREDPRSRTVRRRIPLDLLLALQLAALLALVLALAEPALTRRAATVENLAVVLDGSASMRTQTENGQTRYEAAIEEAAQFLADNPAAKTTVIQLSSQTSVLLARSEDPERALDVVTSSHATDLADGSLQDLLDILGGIGGHGSFDRIVVLSDRQVPTGEAGLESILITGGENWSIDAFSVREDPTDVGALVYVRLANHASVTQDVTLRVEDGLSHVELPISLPPLGNESFVLPFPGSRSSSFTARLEPEDAFSEDNTRFFSLERPLDLKVAWIGEESRYLLAALEAVVPVTWVDRAERADLTVIHRENVRTDVMGNVLVVNGSLAGLVEIGSERPAGQVIALQPDHLLLTGVEVAGLRVSAVPQVETIAGGDVVLTSEETPLLVEFAGEDRVVTFLAPDLLATNFPITVDFPVLIRNIIGRIVKLPAEISHTWAHAGAPFSLGDVSAERITWVETPDGGRISTADGQLQFIPQEPGFYRLGSARGTYPLAVNVAPSESVAVAFAPVASEIERTDTTESGRRLRPLWPWLAGLGACLLIAESVEYSGIRFHRRRNR